MTTPLGNTPLGKAEARAEAKNRREIARAALGPEASRQLADRFFAKIPLDTGQIIAGYVPIGSEADPTEILRRSAARGHRLALPCIEGPGTPLVFRLWSIGDPLLPGPFGTREPAATASKIEPQILLVPLLAFDNGGHRLGYGGGYYDRTLAALRQSNLHPIAVGLAFSGQEVTHIPIEPNDEPLDWVVTEREARAFSGRIS